MSKALRDYKRQILNEKRSLKRSDQLYMKLPYAFASNPILNWKYFPSVIFKYLMRGLISNLPPCKLQVWMLRMMGVQVGNNVGISFGFKIDPWFPDLIEIEDEVIIGENVTLLTHDITWSRIKLGKIVIRAKAMVGANSLIGAGVEIARDSKIALGSVITTSTSPGYLYRDYHAVDNNKETYDPSRKDSRIK